MKNKKGDIILIIVSVIAIIIVVILLISTYKKDKITTPKIAGINDRDRVQIIDNQNNIEFVETKEEMFSNEKCDSKNKKVNYSLEINDGKVLIRNFDNFENFSLNNIKNVTSLRTISYTSNCEDTIYVLLTEEGTIYYSSSDVVNIKKLKNIEDEFKLLKSDYKFSDLLKDKNKNILYSNTYDGKFVNINLK